MSTTAERNADNQNEIVGNARRDHSLFTALIEALTDSGGRGKRQDILEYIAYLIDLTPAQANATHITNTGAIRNNFHDVVDYITLDVRDGKYGPELAEALSADGKGTWTLTGADFDLDACKRINTAAKKSKADITKQYRAELAAEYTKLATTAKKAFKVGGGNMERCIRLMLTLGVTANQALIR